MIDQTPHLNAAHKRVLTALLPPGSEYHRAHGAAGILFHYRTCIDDIQHGTNRATMPVLEYLTSIAALKKIGLPKYYVYRVTDYGRGLVDPPFPQKKQYTPPQVQLGGDIDPDVVQVLKNE